MWGRLVSCDDRSARSVRLDDTVTTFSVATATLNEDGSEGHILAWCRLWVDRLPLRPTWALLRIDDDLEACEIRRNGVELLHGFDHPLEAGDVLSVHAPETGEGCLPRVIVRAQGRSLEHLPDALQWTFEPDPYMLWACDCLHKSDQAVHKLERTVERLPLDWQTYPEVAAEIIARRALRRSSSSDANARACHALTDAAAASEACADGKATDGTPPAAMPSVKTTPAKRGAERMRPGIAPAAKRQSVASP